MRAEREQPSAREREQAESAEGVTERPLRAAALGGFGERGGLRARARGGGCLAARGRRHGEGDARGAGGGVTLEGDRLVTRRAQRNVLRPWIHGQCGAERGHGDVTT